MAVPNDIQYDTLAARRTALANDDGQARTKTLGALVAVMVVAGVVALVLTLFGDNSNSSSAATQPSGSQVGKQSTSVPSVSPASSTAPSTAASTSTVPPAPAPASTTPATTKPAGTTPAPKPARTSASTTTSSKVVKYTVRKGDNLTLIAKWFRQRGVAPVYDWNKSIIGRNPNLIFPGQTIIVSLTGNTMMKVSTGSK